MNTTALAVPVVVGLELLTALGLAWLCWRLAMRRNLHALRDIARALIALGLSAAVQLFDFGGFSATDVARLDLGRSLALTPFMHQPDDLHVVVTKVRCTATRTSDADCAAVSCDRRSSSPEPRHARRNARRVRGC